MLTEYEISPDYVLDNQERNLHIITRGGIPEVILAFPDNYMNKLIESISGF